jgi:hypothetical protein
VFTPGGSTLVAQALLFTRLRKLPDIHQERDGIELRVRGLNLKAPLIPPLEQQEINPAHGQRLERAYGPAERDGVAGV